MATGSGKTFAAVNACYRLLQHAKAERIRFLVDRNNLGRQTLNEFQQFVSPDTGRKFTDEYTVTHLKGNRVPDSSQVVITTIQRLFSMLRGEAEFAEENEESSLHETAAALPERPVEVAYNPDLPVEAFDFVIVDECHRSIYNLWRQVLEYFDASLVGLTATPTAHTLGFFDGNLVHEYTHEKAVADGVTVGFDVSRIETRVGTDGVALTAEPGLFVPLRHRVTRARALRELNEPVLVVAWSPDGNWLASGNAGRAVRVWDVRHRIDAAW